MQKLDFIFKAISQKDEFIQFVDNYNRTWKLAHIQDCCENVYIEDVCGDWDDILNETVYYEETSNQNETNEGSETWSFYKFRTRKGEVVVRFYGSSNGYYGESASFYTLDSNGYYRFGINENMD